MLKMPTICLSFREKSTKTRIETNTLLAGVSGLSWVLEKNPPKQGLKPTI